MKKNRFAIGADISWVPQMREAGFVFRDARGKAGNILDILKEYGVNAIRLRTWVDPSEDPHAGHCSARETLAFARECRDAGFRIMLDFHYGDSWCDCGKQPKPHAWEGLDLDGLVAQVDRYTREVMTLLVSSGVRPEWVQIGNETNLGMLLPEGSTADFARLTRLYNAGHDAVKAVCPEAKTIIHLSEFSKAEFMLRYFEELAGHQCRYDVMGFSYYPYHLPQMTYEACLAGYERAMRELPARFGKELMIVEIGALDVDEEGSYRTVMDTLPLMRAQEKCTGIFWWEPQGARCWSDYPLSAWRDDGTPTHAMDAFSDIAAAYGIG